MDTFKMKRLLDVRQVAFPDGDIVGILDIPDREGCYPCAAVCLYRDWSPTGRPYSIHTFVDKPDRGYFIDGLYDIAERDLAISELCERAGLMVGSGRGRMIDVD